MFRESGNFPELYFRNEFEVHLHVWNWGMNSERSNYCIMYEPCVGMNCKRCLVPSAMVCRWGETIHKHLFGDSYRKGQEFMLVSDIKCLDVFQGKLMSAIPSIVRLQPLDQCSGLRRHNLFNSTDTAFGKVSSILENREHGESICDDSACQFPRDIVEGRSHIVDTIPNHQGQFLSRDRLWIDNTRMIESNFRVSLGDNVVWVTIEELSNAVFDKFEVLFGPITLCIDTEERGRHLINEEETEDQEGCGNSNPEARRLLQGSEEGRHAVTDQRHEVETAQTSPSHRRGGYTATHTRLGNPEDAS